MQNKVLLGNFPTKIEKLDNFSKEMGINIYIKRDDQTGSEISGNKIRKLEFSIKEALDNSCDTLITCGGIQSNHARATTAAAKKLGLRTILVLRSDDDPKMEGNYFINKLLGADIRIISSTDYSESRTEIMKSIQEEEAKKGSKVYIIPEGASNGIGTLGYYFAMEEIKTQEEELGIDFDTVVVAVGSGGTYAGVYLGNEDIYKSSKRIVGFNVCDDAEFFKDKSYDIIKEALPYLDNKDIYHSKDNMEIIDGYVGIGYAKNRSEELDFIYKLASLDGLILDPVYTGKAMYGLFNEIKKGSFKNSKNILFIHTGGLFGLFPKQDEFSF